MNVVEAAALGVRIEADLKPYTDAMKEAERRALATGQRAAKAFKDGSKSAGPASADALLEGLNKAFDVKMADAREELARKLIDMKEFNRRGQEAGIEFNRGLLKGIEQLGERGKLRQTDFINLTSNLKDLEKSAESTGQKFGSMWSLAKGFVAFLAARGVFRFFADSIREAEDAASKWDVLGANVEAAGVSFAKVRPEIEAAATAAQRITRFDDEAYAAALSELVSITHDYARSLGNMDAVLDLAAAKHMDLEAAATLVGKAMIGETGEFMRMGIKIKQGSDAVQQIRDQFRGAAAKEGAGLVGGLARIRNAWDEVKQAVGESLLSNEAAGRGMNSLVDILVRLEGWIRANASAFQTWVDVIASGGSKIGDFIATVARMINPGAADAGLAIAGMRKMAADPKAAGELARRLGEERNALARAQQQYAALGGDKALEEAQKKQAGSMFDPFGRGARDQVEQLKEVKNEAERASRMVNFLEAALYDLGHPKGPPPPPPPGVPTEEELKKARDLLKAWHDDQMADLEKRLAKAKELQAAAQLAGTPEDKASAASAVRAVQAQIDAVQKLGPALQQAAPALMQAFDGLKPNLAKILPTAAELLAPLTTGFGTQMARLKEQLERKVITPEEFRTQGEAAAREFNAGLLAVSDDLRNKKLLTADQYQGLIDALKPLPSEAEAALAPLNAVFEQTSAKLKLEVADHLISPAEAKRQGEEAARKFNAGVLAALGKLRGAGKLTSDDFKALAGALKDVGDEATAALAPLTDAFESKMARLKVELAGKVINPKQFKKLGEEATKEFNAGVLAKLEELRASGKLTEEQFRALAGALKDVQAPGDSGWKKMASTIAGVARGVLSIADAMGELDEQTRKVIEGVADLAEGIGRIAAGDIVGGSVQALGGLVKAISGILSGDKAAREQARLAQLQATAAMNELKAALEALRHAVLADLTATERQEMIYGRDVPPEPGKAHPRGGYPGLQKLYEDTTPDRQVLYKPSYAIPIDSYYLDYLTKLQKATNITFLDMEKGTMSVDGFRRAYEAFLKMDLSVFPDTLEGDIAKLNWKFGLLGDSIVDATHRMQAFVDVLKKRLPALGSQLQTIIDKEGPDAAQKFWNTLVEAFAEGGVDNSLIKQFFGSDMTATEIQAALEEGNKYLQDIATGAGATGQTAAFQVSRTITERQADLLITVLTTLAYWAERGARAQEATAAAATGGAYTPPTDTTVLPFQPGSTTDLPGWSALAAGVERTATAAEGILAWALALAPATPPPLPTPAPLPVTPPPPPTEFGAAGGGAPVVNLSIDRLVTIENLGAGVTTADTAAVTSAARQGATMLVDRIDGAMGDRWAQVRRAAGRSA